MKLELLTTDIIAIQYPDICGAPFQQSAPAPRITPTQTAPPTHTATPPTSPAPAPPQPPKSTAQEFRALVDGEVAKGHSRAEATTRAIRANQDLHARYVAEVNEQRTVAPTTATASQKYSELVTQEMRSSNCSASEAKRLVNTKYPTERRAFVAEVNQR